MSKTLCIAGMHRSGTSLTAHWLHKNGLFIGDELLGKASTNQKGHFEDTAFLDLHISLLETQKLHRSGLFLPKDYNLLWDKDHRKKAQHLVQKRALQHDQWGWKEPRSTLYLREWKTIIPKLKVLALYRHPLSVVNSLYVRLKRNKWYKTRNPFKKALWYFDIDCNPRKWHKIFEDTYNRYNQEILDFQSSYPNDIILVNLDDLKQNSLKLLKFMEHNFDLEFKEIALNDIFDENLMTPKKELQSIKIKLESSLSLFDQLEASKYNF